MAPIGLEDGEPMVGIVEGDSCQPLADQPDGLEGVGALGDHLAQLASTGDVDRHHAATRRVQVGEQVERAVHAGDRLVARICGIEQRPNPRGLHAARQVGDVDAVGRIGAAPDADDEKAAVIGHLGLVAPLGLVRRREHDRVVCGIGTEAVIAQLHVPVRRVVGGVGRRLRVAGVEEATVVMGPRRRRELAPRQAIGQVLPGGNSTNGPGPPVGAGVADGVGDELTALGDRRGRHGGGAVVAQRVRVEERSAGRIGRVRRPQHVLVLEPGVAQLEPALATTPRGAGSRVVPQLGQPCADLRTRGHLAEHALGQRVLGIDPRARGRRIGVLERAVGIGDALAVVVVDLVGGRGSRIVEARHQAGSWGGAHVGAARSRKTSSR